MPAERTPEQQAHDEEMRLRKETDDRRHERNKEAAVTPHTDKAGTAPPKPDPKAE